jgi:hypothetical protein
MTNTFDDIVAKAASAAWEDISDRITLAGAKGEQVLTREIVTSAVTAACLATRDQYREANSGQPSVPAECIKQQQAGDMPRFMALAQKHQSERNDLLGITGIGGGGRGAAEPIRGSVFGVFTPGYGGTGASGGSGGGGNGGQVRTARGDWVTLTAKGYSDRAIVWTWDGDPRFLKHRGFIE